MLNAAKGTDSYMTVLGTVRATTLAGAQAAAAARFSPPFLVQAPAAPPAELPSPTAETSAAQATEEPKAELQPGQVLVRDYKGAEYRVEITDSGLMYQGKRYSSLTAVAKAITGYDSINGKAFFSLVGTTKQPKAKKLTKSEAFASLLAAAKETKTLWDKNGLGDDDQESEPVYTMLAIAIEGAEEVLK